MKAITALLILLLLNTAVSARIIKVPADYSTIQAAIAGAVNGDTVVVYPGTYYENINFNGKNIVVTSRYYESRDNSFILSTVIDGSRSLKPDTASAVLFIHHEDTTAVIQGFTITKGGGTNWRDEHGAGVYREGGGILVALCSPTIKNNLIINNVVVKNSKVSSCGGGGIRVGDGNPRILNNVFALNKGRYGAGIVLNFTGAVIRNNIICYNTGGEDYGGGGIWINNNGASSKIIQNNTIVGNYSALGGGGIYNYAGASSVIKNNIIWKNTAPSNPQYYSKSGLPSITYCDVQGGVKGNGNINIDPQFQDTVNFYLKNSSPCIDAGDSSSVYNDPADPQNPNKTASPSVGGLRNDIGAYGGPGRLILSGFQVVTGVKETRQNGTPQGFLLQQNYPNPFNPSTIISYRLPADSRVSLKIYDLPGREIATLVDGYQTAGEHSFSFNIGQSANRSINRSGVNHLSSGIYLYRLEVFSSGGKSGEFFAVKKMIVLK
jgi:Right handed beta helix region